MVSGGCYPILFHIEAWNAVFGNTMTKYIIQENWGKDKFFSDFPA